MTAAGLPKVGRYQLLRRLGAGGMAEVFEATSDSGERVAIKTIRASLRGDPKFVEMFLNEARIAASLAHPNIVRVIEVAETAGVPFIAMECVSGSTLQELLGRQAPARTPATVAAAVMARVAAALHHAHDVAATPTGERIQVIHRDVSPANIMIAAEGRVLLLDFGVAKAHGAPGFLQSSGDLLKGKLRYMAPELVDGGSASPLTDLFAAGAVLFEMVTGQCLYPEARDADLMSQVASGKRRPVRELAPDCPARLEEFIDAAVHPDPAKRFAGAQAWGAALDEVASALPNAGASAIAGWAQALVPPPPTVPGLPAASPPPRSLGADALSEEITAQGRDADTELRAKKVAAQPPTVPGVTAVVARPPPSRPQGENPVRLATLILTLVVVLVVGILLGELDPSSTRVVVTAPPGHRVATPPSPFVLYLDGAEQALAEGRFDSARESISFARKLGSSDARQNLRMLDLASRVEREAGAAKVRSLARIGDFDGARRELRQLVEHDPDPNDLEKLSKELDAAAARTPGSLAALGAANDGGAPMAAADAGSAG